jgi:ABC-type nitrate/sulfonate/bicarbonate transport system permease component
MRLLLSVIAAGGLSFAVAFGLVYAASHWLPCFDDRAACGLGEVYGTIGTLFYAPLAMIVFGLTLWRWPTERAIGIVALVLLTPIILLLLYGILLNEAQIRLRELQGALQFFVPLALTVLVQWFVLRGYLRRRAG